MRSSFNAFMLLAALGLSACSSHESSTVALSTPASSSTVSSPFSYEGRMTKAGMTSANLGSLTAAEYEQVVQKGHGFTVGPSMATEVAYVFFDPQCPHCGESWAQSVPLQTTTRIVWMPIAFLNAQSLPQGAALLGASNPVELMASHEASIKNHQGGLPVMGKPDPVQAANVNANLELLKALHASGVPFMIHKGQDGAIHTVNGEMTTEELKVLLAS